jgi:hypothetical protein
VQNIQFVDIQFSCARVHAGQKTFLKDNPRYFQELSNVALPAAIARGEILFFWVVKMWLRRFAIAYKTRMIYKIKGSLFHQTVLKTYIHKLGMGK